MGKKRQNDEVQGKGSQDPQVVERQRLRKLAFVRKIISETPANTNSANGLEPSKLLLNGDGKDIVKKSQRKSKYLFAFPCLVAPVSGGKLGELMHLDTKNPILYMEFPQGRMKFFGTIVYPKNKYLTLYFPRGSGNIICEDSFDSLVVFSDVWWIGTKEENPDELRMDFPTELNQKKHEQFDFKGGAGKDVDIENISGRKLYAKELDEMDIDSDSKIHVPHVSGNFTSCFNITDKQNIEPETNVAPAPTPTATPTRTSRRTAGKVFKFVESPSENDTNNTESAQSSSDSEETPFSKGQNVDQNLGTSIEQSFAKDQPIKEANTGSRKGKGNKANDNAQPPSSSKGVLVQTSIASYVNKSEEKEKKSQGRQKIAGTKARGKQNTDTSTKKSSDSIVNVSDDDVVEVQEQPKKRKGRKHGKGESGHPRKKLKFAKKIFKSEDEMSTSSEPSDDEKDEDWVE